MTETKSLSEIKSIQSSFREKGIARKEAIINLGLENDVRNDPGTMSVTGGKYKRNLIDTELSKIIACKIKSGSIVPDSTNLPIYEELMVSGNIDKIISDGVVLKHFPSRIWNQLEIYGPGIEGRKLWDWRIKS